MKNKLIPILVMALIGLSLLLVRRQAMADPATTEPYREVVVDLDTGVHDGGQERDAILVYDELVHVPDAIWLRLHIPDYYLGSGSYLQLTARQDGSQQRLDSISLPNWSNYSAYFNGDSVRVELYVAPEDTGVYARLDRALAGVMIPAGRGAGAPSEPESLCGADDRIASTDQRTGRLSTLTTGPVAFCTAWLISNGSLLTAGHCADSDPDDFGPLLPDGVLDWTANTVVEFNVPASLPNGQVVIAAADHQYPVNLNSVVWAYGGDGGVLGNDWAVFRVNPNTNTGRLPHQIRGFYRVIDLNPARRVPYASPAMVWTIPRPARPEEKTPRPERTRQVSDFSRAGR